MVSEEDKAVAVVAVDSAVAEVADSAVASEAEEVSVLEIELA